jgi:hypothetical protein
MTRMSVGPMLFTLLLAGSPAAAEDAHLVSLADVAARIRDVEPHAQPLCVTEPAAPAAPLSEEERDELRRRADALAKDPHAAGAPAAIEGMLGFIGGFAFVTLVGLAIAAN